MNIEGLGYVSKREVFEYLQVTENNYFECVNFILSCHAELKQENASLNKRLKRFKKEGIYFFNKKGEFCKCSIGSYLIRDFNDLIVEYERDFERKYKNLSTQEEEEMKNNKFWDYSMIEGI